MHFNFNKTVSVSAPINIALVKYWGKRDERLIIPKNNSISLTLDKNNLQSLTRLTVSTSLTECLVVINAREAKMSSRMTDMFQEALNKSKISPENHEKLKFQLNSTNNFPTAAGLASSASGMAAFAFALGRIFDLSMEDVSELARLGSGSATRSVFGGIVEWRCNNRRDSRSIQLYDENYWPDLRVLICIVSGAEKKTPSTAGMQKTIKTSQLSRYRFKHGVKKNLKLLRKALLQKDFSSLAAVTMKESNQLHAICLDTVPPIIYLNSASFSLIEFVECVNDVCATPILAYTFDAGPNAFLLYEKHNLALIRHLLQFSFHIDPKLLTDETEDHNDINHNELPFSLHPDKLQALYDRLPQAVGVIDSIISTQIGSGPEECPV